MNENRHRKKSVGTKRQAFRSSRSDTIDGSDDRGDTGSNDQQLAIKNATSRTDEKHSSSSSSSVPDLVLSVSSSEPSPTNLTPNENTAREVCDRNLTSLEPMQDEVTNCTGKQKSNTKPGLEKQKSVTFVDSEPKKSRSTRRDDYRSSGHGTGESSTEGKSNDSDDDEVFDSDSATDRRDSYRQTKRSSGFGTGESTTEQDDDESHNSDMIPDFDLLLKESSDAEPSADQNKGLNYPNNMSENYPKNESLGNNHIECFAQSSDHHSNELQNSSEKQKDDHINPVDIHVITSNKNISSDSQNKDKLKQLENKDQQDDVGFLRTSQIASHPVPSQNTIQQNWNGNKMESQCSSDSPVKYMACSINQDSSKENSLDTSVYSPPIINTYGVKKLSNINLRISDTEDDSHQPVNRTNSVQSQKSASSMSIEDFLTGLPDDTSIVSTTSQTDDPHDKDTQKMLEIMLEENKKEAQIAKLASGQFELEDESESDDDNTMDNIQLHIEDEDEDEDEQLLLETTVKKIAKASQCDVDCGHIDCREGKNLVQHLQHHLEVEKMLTCRMCDYIVKCIWHHSSSCLEMNCPVAFCGYLCKNDVESVEDAVNCTAQSINLHMPTYTGKNKIHSTLAIGDLKDLPKMYAVTKLSGFGHCKTCLVHAASKKMWVIKQISQNRNQHLIGVLRRVLPDNHCHIVEHLWASQHEDSLQITICTKFEMPGSLQQYIGLLPVSLKLSCLRQLLDATDYLHALDVIYLLWTSCNIVLDDKCNWKLSNFSSAVFVNYSWQVEEIEDMVMYLPTNIIPPELLNQPPEKPTASCDIWGIGCLTFEMCTGLKIRHEMLHFSPEEIRKQIPLSPCPNINNCENPFQKIMSMCFKDNPAERASVAELKEHLDFMKMNY